MENESRYKSLKTQLKEQGLKRNIEESLVFQAKKEEQGQKPALWWKKERKIPRYAPDQ